MKELLPDPDQVERFRGNLADPGFGAGWTIGFLNAVLPELADKHARDCTLAVCETCDILVTVLSVFAAFQIEHPPSEETLRQMPPRPE